MSPFSTLTDIAQRVDELLFSPPRMAKARQLVEACLADPAQSHGEAFGLPEVPGGFSSREGDVTLTPGQTAVVLAALHDVHCPGVEKVVVLPPEDSLRSGELTSDYRRALKWTVILDKVCSLGDFALHWYALQLRRFEQFVSDADAQHGAPPAVEMPPPQMPTNANPKADRQIKERLALAELLTEGPNATRIAQKIGVPRTTLLGWPTFRQHYNQAKNKLKNDSEQRRRRLRRGNLDGNADEDDE